MLKIGLVGVGHLGEIHLKCIQQIPDFKFVGFYEQNQERAKIITDKYVVPSFIDLERLMDQCDVIDIVTPTPKHFEVAMLAVSRGKHVFIEKPIVSHPDEADILLKAAKENKVKIQVGHVERYNPAFLAMEKMQLNPMFIEGHRLATFNPRGNDVSVVLDLMIHDLDIILKIVKSNVKEILANGVAVVSEQSDIANVRITFENGCVANLTASRISLKQMRKIRLFQKNAYVAMDFLEKESQIVKLTNEKPVHTDNTFELELPTGSKWLEIQMPESKNINAIVEELKSFYKAVKDDTRPAVTGEEATEALKLAYKILHKIEQSNEAAFA